MRDASKFALSVIVIMMVVLFFIQHHGSRQTMMLNAPVSGVDFNRGAMTMNSTLIIVVLCIVLMWWSLCELWCWDPALN